MKMTLKQLAIEGFKGIPDGVVYDFDERMTVIRGRNGTGKTTIFTAFIWLFADKDAELKSNPSVYPIGAEEATPRVEAILDIDGKQVQAAKMQKRTVKKARIEGLKDSTSFANTYEVNYVECGERDFKAKMSEYGMDFDLFLPLAHLDAFTGKKADEMRAVLFSMTSSKTDYEIAQQTEGAQDAAKLLANYNAEEVHSMQNTTIRKIREEYGKDGEILRARIEGLENAKAQVDVKALEGEKQSIKAKIDALTEQRADAAKQGEAYTALADEVMALRVKLSDIKRSYAEDYDKERQAIEEEAKKAADALGDTKAKMGTLMRGIESARAAAQKATTERDALRKKYAEEKAVEFDDAKLNCPYCGQEYPQERKEQIKADFETKKQERLAEIVEAGNKLNAEIKKQEEHIAACEENCKKGEGIKEKQESAYAAIKERLDTIRQNPPAPTGSDEYKAVEAQIAEKEAQMNGMKSHGGTATIDMELKDLTERMSAIDRRLATADNNERIDDQIKELLELQSQYEQNKADAEKILYQLDLVGKRKNGLLTDEINDHFEIVRFKLFDYLKNGEYKEVCIPTYADKRLGESANKGLEMLMKLDIIRGLQKFFGQYYPVFVDNAESMSLDTIALAGLDCQAVYLMVDGGELRFGRS